MNNSNGKVKASYDKRLNYTATGILIIWILIIIFGFFSSINPVLLYNVPFIWAYNIPFIWAPFCNIFLGIVLIIGFVPSRSISISLVNLLKNRRWIEPSKFIKSILIQLVTASIASILTIFFYQANDFTEFFSMFSSFVFILFFVFLGFCIYYYGFDVPERQNLRNPNLKLRY